MPSRYTHAFLLAPLLGMLAFVPAAAQVAVTEPEIAKMNAKLDSAREYLRWAWEEVFRLKGFTYRTPSLVPYRLKLVTPCGSLRANNAFFCSKSNTIYYDEIFLTRIMKVVGQRLHTDGDYAPITILAHEWGHAVQFWIEQGPRASPYPWNVTYLKEAEADCFAGAITHHAESLGYLEPGDLREGEALIQLSGDVPVNGMDVWYSAVAGHGTSVQRLANFRRGYLGGASACNLWLSPQPQ